MATSCPDLAFYRTVQPNFLNLEIEFGFKELTVDITNDRDDRLLILDDWIENKESGLLMK